MYIYEYYILPFTVVLYIMHIFFGNCNNIYQFKYFHILHTVRGEKINVTRERANGN